MHTVLSCVYVLHMIHKLLLTSPRVPSWFTVHSRVSVESQSSFSTNYVYLLPTTISQQLLPLLLAPLFLTEFPLLVSTLPSSSTRRTVIQRFKRFSILRLERFQWIQTLPTSSPFLFIFVFFSFVFLTASGIFGH